MIQVAVDYVEVSFGIDANALGPKHRAPAVADHADGVLELPRAIHRLHPEVHGVHDHQVLPVQPQLGREVELARALSPFCPMVLVTLPFMSSTKILLRSVSVT